jgi:uncharacterized membrane protein YfcA
MNRKTQKLFALATAILSFIFAIVILFFADGIRRWYSGGFFILIAIVMFFNYLRFEREEVKSEE